MLTKEKLQEVSNDLFSGASKILKSKGSFYMHVVMIREEENGKPGIAMIPIDPSEFEDIVPSLVETFTPEAMLVISEAWQSYGEHPDGLTPSQRNDRYEVLMMSMEHVDYGSTFRQSEIIRNSKGKIAQLKPMDMGKFSSVKSRFVGYLSRRNEQQKFKVPSRKPGYKSFFKSDKYIIH